MNPDHNSYSLVIPQKISSPKTFYIVFYPQAKQKIFHNFWPTYYLKPLFFCYVYSSTLNFQNDLKY